MLSLQDFRDTIREHLDLDEDDLSDLLVDEFVRDAAQKLQYHRQTWPFYETVWTFDTVADQGTYTLAEVGVSDPTSVVAEIHSIRSQTRVLRASSIGELDSASTLASPSTGEPLYWAQWGNGDVVLDPIPVGVQTLQVRGWKAPTEWVSEGAGGTSDAPEPFDRVILNWALGRAYTYQDEPESAMFFAQLGDIRLRELTKSFDDVRPNTDVVMGGARNRGWLADGRVAGE